MAKDREKAGVIKVKRPKPPKPFVPTCRKAREEKQNKAKAENKTYNLIGIDDDPKALQQEIFEIPMVVDILITDDF